MLVIFGIVANAPMISDCSLTAVGYRLGPRLATNGDTEINGQANNELSEPQAIARASWVQECHMLLPSLKPINEHIRDCQIQHEL